MTHFKRKFFFFIFFSFFFLVKFWVKYFFLKSFEVPWGLERCSWLSTGYSGAYQASFLLLSCFGNIFDVKSSCPLNQHFGYCWNYLIHYEANGRSGPNFYVTQRRVRGLRVYSCFWPAGSRRRDIEVLFFFVSPFFFFLFWHILCTKKKDVFSWLRTRIEKNSIPLRSAAPEKILGP